MTSLEPMTTVDPNGAMDPLTLRFLDTGLEGRYQEAAGVDGLAGYRFITGASGFLWSVAAVLLPNETNLPTDVAIWSSLFMAALSSGALLASGWATTLDRQHGLIAAVTSANGLVVLILASAAGLLPGYGVATLLLLYSYGFVSRTRFIFAAVRTAIVTAGLVVAIFAYVQPRALLLDVFLYTAGIVGMLLALRLLEQARRRVFFQELVIRGQAAELEREKDQSDQLLLNILPASVSARLRQGEQRIADEYPSVSVLFADIVGFTPLAAQLSPSEMIDLLGGLFTEFDGLVAERGLEKIKTIGDAYMAAGGLPEPIPDHATRVVDLGLAMVEAAARHARDGQELALRVGIHSGPVVGGVIGTHKFAFDIWGDTVNVASRLESHGARNRVHVSRTTRDLAGDAFDYRPLGALNLRGHRAMEAFAVVGRRSAAVGPV